MRRLVLLAATAAVAVLGATAAAQQPPAPRSTQSSSTMRPLFPDGSVSICRQFSRHTYCLTREDNGNTGDHNELWFAEGVHAYGGYWFAQFKGTVGERWPFSIAWFNHKWYGHQVYEAQTFTFNHQFAMGTCPKLAVKACLMNTGGQDYFVVMKGNGGTWRMLAVNATDRIWKLTGGRNISYFLTYNGSGRKAIFAPNGDNNQSLKVNRA
jgi:hypothetical protein